MLEGFGKGKPEEKGAERGTRGPEGKSKEEFIDLSKIGKKSEAKPEKGAQPESNKPLGKVWDRLKQLSDAYKGKTEPSKPAKEGVIGEAKEAKDKEVKEAKPAPDKDKDSKK